MVCIGYCAKPIRFSSLLSARFAAVYNDSEIEDMIFAYINQVAAIYRVSR